MMRNISVKREKSNLQDLNPENKRVNIYLNLLSCIFLPTECLVKIMVKYNDLVIGPKIPFSTKMYLSMRSLGIAAHNWVLKGFQ